MKRLVLLLALAGCDASEGAATDGGGDASMTDEGAPGDGGGDDQGPVPDGESSSRGFPATGPWVSFYGTASEMGDLAKAASTFRVINIDADPTQGNFTDAQIQQLRAGGQNRVISYLDLGSCENFRSYWSSAPSGLVSCSANTAAQLGAYAGYPDEVWMNPSNPDYQNLIVQYVAPTLAARGVDGFFLDNLEIVEHGTMTTDGPCDAACAQGGLDLVGKLRAAFPDLLIVMQNATSDKTRLGKTSSGVPFPSLLDGVSHEEVSFPTADATALGEMMAWRSLGLTPGGRRFFLGTEDYVGSCSNTTDAMTAYSTSRSNGLDPYATDASAGQRVVCYWGF
jgi:cysteinyl-tRNA synthetase